MSIDTSKVQGRRTLRFHTLDEAIADAEKLVAADKAGTLKRLGNWTTGMILSHVAAFANYPYDGYPESIEKVPWFVRLLGPLMRKRMIHKGMPSGVKIPRVKGGTVGFDDVPAEEGLRRLRFAFERMKKGPPQRKNPLLGNLTHHEWMQMQCRHAELHFSFLVP